MIEKTERIRKGNREIKVMLVFPALARNIEQLAGGGVNPDLQYTDFPHNTRKHKEFIKLKNNHMWTIDYSQSVYIDANICKKNND